MPIRTIKPKKPRSFSKTRAKTARPFRVPAVPRRRSSFEGTRGEGEFRPLAPPEIPLPPDEDSLLQERFDAWRGVQGRTAASLPEFIVWEYLVNKRRLRPNVDFLYQSPLFGGRTQFGGFVIDYYFPNRREGWRVQGERYHLLNPVDRAKDSIAKVIIAAQGIKLIDLWENDLLTRPDFVLDAAWFRGVGVGRKAVI